jgi:transcriptional regulator with XRE-family HTH domain
MTEPIGDRLRALRRAKNLTLREAAGHLDINHAYLSQLETGLAKPSEELASRIARLYGADVEELVFLARDMPQVIEDIKKKFPNVSPAYFRKMLKPANRK